MNGEVKPSKEVYIFSSGQEVSKEVKTNLTYPFDEIIEEWQFGGGGRISSKTHIRYTVGRLILR